MAELASFGQTFRSFLCWTRNQEKAGGLRLPGGYRTWLPATSCIHNLRTLQRLVLGNRKEHLALEQEGESAVHLCDEAAELLLAVFQTLQILRAMSPLRQLLWPHSSWLARSVRLSSSQEAKKHTSTGHWAVVAAYCPGSGWPQRRHRAAQTGIGQDAQQRQTLSASGLSATLGLQHVWVQCKAFKVFIWGLETVTPSDHQLLYVFCSSVAQSCPTLWETPGLQHARHPCFFSIARWVWSPYCPQASKLKSYDETTTTVL